MKTIDVGRDFSRTPGPRYERQGKYSGEQFRKLFLEEPLRNGDEIVVNLEGCDGFTTSFLDESFGELVRIFGAGVVGRVHIVSPTMPHRVEQAYYFMNRRVGQQ